jgi:L-lactate dehydrogenase
MVHINKSKSKVAIIGAGFVGAASAYALTLCQTASEIVLIDINREKALGEVLDINHGLAFIGQMNVYAGDYCDVKDCDVIIITAGVARKPGETRLELAKKNTAITKSIIQNVMQYYNQGVILVVSNPVDVLTYFVQKWSGLPNGMVFGTGTTLDSARFRYTLGKRLNVDVKNIHGYIIGEHGDSQITAWSTTHIAGEGFDDFCRNNGKEFSESDKIAIQEEIKNAGAYIIKNKGATYYAIATAVNSLVQSIIKNQNTIRTVSSVLNGIYGINDVALSVPVMINGDGIFDYLHLNFTQDELSQLQTSAEQLKLVIRDIENN